MSDMLYYAFTPPVLTDFSWVNQGASTATQSGDVVYCSAPVATPPNLRLLTKSSYDGVYGVFTPAIYRENNISYGVVLRDSSSNRILALQYIHDNGTKIRFADYESPTSSPTVYKSYDISDVINFIGLRIRRADWYSIGELTLDGANWISIETISNPCTYNESGIFLQAGGSTYPCNISLVSFYDTPYESSIAAIRTSKAVSHNLLEPYKGASITKVAQYLLLEEDIDVIGPSDDIPPITDRTYASITHMLSAIVRDSLPSLSDGHSTTQYGSIKQSLADDIPVVTDSILGIIKRVIAQYSLDNIPAITDRVFASLINLNTDKSWLVPITITPRTNAISPLNLSAHPIRHPSKYFEPRIKSHGTFTRAISAPVGFIKSGDCTLTLSDADNSVRRRLGEKTIHGATAEVRLGPEDGSLSAFLRPFRREVNLVEQNTDGDLQITLTDNILPALNEQIPSLIDTTNFPNLPQESAGKFAPIVCGQVYNQEQYDTPYVVESGGSWISRVIKTLINKAYNAMSGNEGGAVECISVDPDNKAYLVARHPLNYMEFWKKRPTDEVFVRETAAFPYTEVLPSGHLAQMVYFPLSSSGITPDTIIRADVEDVAPESYEFIGFHGEYGGGINNIGIVSKNSAGETHKSDAYGGPGDVPGTAFEDTDLIPTGGRISHIAVWATEWVIATQIYYSDGSKGPKYGGSSGVFYLFEVEWDERITQVEITHTAYVRTLRFFTSKGRASQYYGSPTSSATRITLSTIQAPSSNFADAILDLLTNHLALTGTSDRINYASFADTREKVADLICSGAITEQITWGEALTRFQRSSNIDIFADKDDKLSARYTTDDDEPNHHFDDVLRLHKGSIKQSTATPTYNRLPYNYAVHYGADKWIEASWDNESDIAATGRYIQDEPVNLWFVRDAATAQTVMERRSEYLDLNAFRFEGDVPLIPTVNDLELGDIVSVEHFGGIKDGGYVDEQFKITDLSMDLDNLKYRFKGIRRKLPIPPAIETQLQGIIAENTRPGPWQTDREGELLACFKSSTNPRRITIFRSLNYGQSWSEQDTAGEPTFSNTIGSYDCCQYEGKIHIATQEDSTGKVQYHTYDEATAAWETINRTVVASLANAGAKCVSIEYRYPDGQMFIFFQGSREKVGSTWRERGYYSTLTTSWSGPVLVTPDPGSHVSYILNQWGSADCRIERVVSGRNNRMHFFWNLMPHAWSQGQYASTMSSGGTMSAPVYLYYNNAIYYPTLRNIAGWCTNQDRTKIYLPRRGWWMEPYLEELSEGYPIAHAAWSMRSGVFNPFMGATNQNPSGFVAANPETNRMYWATADYNAGYPVLREYELSSNAYQYENIIGPRDLIGSLLNNYGMQGSVLTFRNREYVAYFCGSATKLQVEPPYPTFRMLRIDKLPYEA